MKEPQPNLDQTLDEVLLDLEFPPPGREGSQKQLEDIIDRVNDGSLTLCEADIEGVVRVWKHCPEQRPTLASLIARNPHRSWVFLVEEVVATIGVYSLDLAAWFALEPSLLSALKTPVVQRSHDYKNVRGACRSALLWVRYFEGGQDAWDAMARALKYAWLRRQRWKSFPPPPDLDILREEMSRLAADEQTELDAALARIGCIDAFGDPVRFF